MLIPTYTGAYAVIVRDGSILLTHWVGAPEQGVPPAWTLPGGGIEVGETPEQTVVRELREETGYEVEVDRVLCVDTGWLAYDAQTQHRIRILHSATILGGELGVVEIDGRGRVGRAG